jgi:hypothetical protein
MGDSDDTGLNATDDDSTPTTATTQLITPFTADDKVLEPMVHTPTVSTFVPCFNSSAG